MLPSNKDAKETARGMLSTRSSVPHSEITLWRKPWKQKQLARACNKLQLNSRKKEIHRLYNRYQNSIFFSNLSKLHKKSSSICTYTKTPWSRRLLTCKTTLRKQLFWRFCNPGSKRGFSTLLLLLLLLSLTKDQGNLIGMTNFLASFSANMKPTKPTRPATVTGIVEAGFQFLCLWYKDGKPCLRLRRKPWPNIAKLLLTAATNILWVWATSLRQRDFDGKTEVAVVISRAAGRGCGQGLARLC